jgi:hypothetical protein
MRLISTALILALTAGKPILAQSQESPPALEEILHRADSVRAVNDSILAETKFSFKSHSMFNRVDGDGNIESSDTTISIITMLGHDEISREVIYSSNGDQGKKMKRQEGKIPLSPDNPDYNFSLTGWNDGAYKVAVMPRKSPPGKGDYEGSILIDSGDYSVRRMDFVVPRPEGALKEFSIDMNFKPLEGGLVVPTDMRIRGYVKALLGLVKVRFTGEILFSDYQILE